MLSSLSSQPIRIRSCRASPACCQFAHSVAPGGTLINLHEAVPCILKLWKSWNNLIGDLPPDEGYGHIKLAVKSADMMAMLITRSVQFGLQSGRPRGDWKASQCITQDLAMALMLMRDFKTFRSHQEHEHSTVSSWRCPSDVRPESLTCGAVAVPSATHDICSHPNRGWLRAQCSATLQCIAALAVTSEPASQTLPDFRSSKCRWKALSSVRQTEAVKTELTSVTCFSPDWWSP